jgi:hypothetical protein
MEFLRFGSSIPGGYWGCCACCIIQDFNQDPDAKASIQLVYGDAGSPVMQDRGFVFAGPTYRDIFWQRIRVGTFDQRDMPDHAFLAILTKEQLDGSVGSKWLAILKEAGFEFIRTVDNSVYSGQGLLTGEPEAEQPSSGGGCCDCGDPDCSWGDDDEDSNYPNYIFGLFRNIGTGAIANPFEPPAEWTALKETVPDLPPIPISLAKEQREAQRKIWDNMPRPPFLSQEEVEKAGAIVTLAGLRSEFPPQPLAEREKKKVQQAAKVAAPSVPVNPFK